MIVTEEEAKTKWCPEARLQGVDSTFNRTDNEYAIVPMNSRCIAARCMAWRWQGVHVKPDQDVRYGYCGKAGKP